MTTTHHSSGSEAQGDGQPHILLVLSHRRSGSSLLVHLLNSNPDIIGYGETHVTYHTAAELEELPARVYEAFDTEPNGERWAMDKLVNGYLWEPHLLDSPRVRSLFLLREPEAALASMTAGAPKHYLRRSFSYYERQLRRLGGWAEAAGRRRGLFLTHQQLLFETPRAFAAIERFLGLSAPLSEEYQTIFSTGVEPLGDISERIHQGRIDRTPPAHELELPALTRQHLRNCFERCLDRLAANVRSIDDA